MNRAPNPKVIGAFITAAGVLLVGLILFFGSASVFRTHDRFILFFDQSVNGLTVGSPVKFRGVPIGSVDRILIRAEGQRAGSTAIPVIIKVNRDRLAQDLGGIEAMFQPKTTEESVRSGLYGQLNLESFITGQLFVEFSVDPLKVADFRPHLEDPGGRVEIATVGSPFDQITEDVVQLVTDVSEVDLGRLTENVNRVLENLAVALEGIDSEGISTSVTRAADSVSDLVTSEEFTETVASLRSTLDEVRETVSTYDLEDGPFGGMLGRWTEQFGTTLRQLDELVASANQLTQPDSTLRFELENALRELGRASRSIRTFTEYLERNPNALITGRPEEEE